MHVRELEPAEWRRRKADHEARTRPWADEHVRRQERQIRHPVRDFLFEYYSHRPSHLVRWSPGVNVRLLGATPADLGWKVGFEQTTDGLILPATAFPRRRIEYLRWAVQYLRTVLDREPAFGCFGLHEWAMVYRTDDIRHSKVPLRLSADEIAGVVEGQGLRCTHYDAFRFFTPAAAPRNRVPLTRAVAVDHDQAGCIHANMDLYRFAYHIAPYSTGELIADTFALALEARYIDMRASPYDLRSYGCEPIHIETKSGREEYVEAQRSLAMKVAPLREWVHQEYADLLDAIEDV